MLDLRADTERTFCIRKSFACCKGMCTARNSTPSAPPQEEWVGCGHPALRHSAEDKNILGHATKETLSCAFSQRPLDPPTPARTSPACSKGQGSRGSQVTPPQEGEVSPQTPERCSRIQQTLRSRPFSQASLTAKHFFQPWGVSQLVTDRFDVYSPG